MFRMKSRERSLELLSLPAWQVGDPAVCAWRMICIKITFDLFAFFASADPGESHSMPTYLFLVAD